MRGGMPIPTSYVDSKETNGCYLEHGGERKAVNDDEVGTRANECVGRD